MTALLQGARTPLVRVDGLSVAYPGGDPVLRDVNLEIGDGEFVVLAGASGSGKSTLLGALCGLVPHTTGGTVAGTVRVGSMDLRSDGPQEFGAVCGVVTQQPESQLVLTTVRAELALGPELRGASPAAIARAVEEVALALGVQHLLGRKLMTLSGGELQRVAIGAALTQQPRLLVLDEPTSQLDPVAGDELLGALRRLNEEWGLTIVLAEHRLERCLPAADRVVALGNGAVAFDGPPAEFCAWAAGAAPALATSAARMLDTVGLAGAAVSVKRAREALRDAGLLEGAADAAGFSSAPPTAPAANGSAAVPPSATARRGRWRRQPTAPEGAAAIELRRGWRELPSGHALLRGVDLTIAPGEAVALMGRNGAGKTTLLRALAGLDGLQRGRLSTAGRVALLMQRSADHLIYERLGDELPEGFPLERIGLFGDAQELRDRHPRDLSGGQQQLLALAVVTEQRDGAPPVAALCLDEPTRGLDRLHRRFLVEELARHRAAGTATLTATHDPEFAASVATRVILLGDGEIIADGPVEEILGGGWYFSTETARVLHTPGVVRADQGIALLQARRNALSPDRSEEPPS